MNRNWVIENKLALDEKWRELHFVDTRQRNFIVGLLITEVVFVVRRRPLGRFHVCLFVCLSAKEK